MFPTLKRYNQVCLPCSDCVTPQHQNSYYVQVRREISPSSHHASITHTPPRRAPCSRPPLRNPATCSPPTRRHAGGAPPIMPLASSSESPHALCVRRIRRTARRRRRRRPPGRRSRGRPPAAAPKPQRSARPAASCLLPVPPATAAAAAAPRGAEARPFQRSATGAGAGAALAAQVCSLGCGHRCRISTVIVVSYR